jgi:outer membrane lipoprotein-sorting protein
VSTDIPDLVPLVYRADWKQLRLSATLRSTFDPKVARRLRERKAAELGRVLGPLRGAWRMPGADDQDHGTVHSERAVLIAPGGRYRVERNGKILVVCDGEHRWHISRGVAHRHVSTGPDAKFCGLLTPQWLIACYDLEITGESTVSGRRAISVTGTPRAASTRRRGVYHLLDRVEVLVDAELGILLRSRQVFEGETRESAELRDPVIDPAQAETTGTFTLPPGMRVEDDEDPFANYQPPGGVGWRMAGAAAGAAANAVSFAIRHAPRQSTVWPTDDEEPDMPADAVLARADWEYGQPPDDRTVNLLHRTGLSTLALTADLHEWIDVQPWLQRFKALQDKIPAPLEGIFGPDAVWDALGERVAEDAGGHRVAKLAVQIPGRYRLDQESGDWNKRYKAIACDGEHTTKLFADRVATGPPKPLDAPVAAMLDPAWLLNGWRLAVVGPASVAGRDGIRIRAIAAGTADNGADALFNRADVVVDAELGVLLRNTTYFEEQPATRTELRGLKPLDDTSFRIEPEPGMRVVTDSGGPLSDRNLPCPAEAAATAATLAAAGAAALTGWLDKHKARRDQR